MHKIVLFCSICFLFTSNSSASQTSTHSFMQNGKLIGIARIFSNGSKELEHISESGEIGHIFVMGTIPLQEVCNQWASESSPAGIHQVMSYGCQAYMTLTNGIKLMQLQRKLAELKTRADAEEVRLFDQR